MMTFTIMGIHAFEKEEEVFASSCSISLSSHDLLRLV
jgi:hypothetical protein